MIAQLLEEGLVSERSAAGWKLQCLDHRALEDARVQAFLLGWHQRAIEVLRELQAPQEESAEADEVRRILDDEPS